MSTTNICHRSSTTKQFHIHKNTNNKDICNTNNKLFMILYNCNFMMYCMRFHTGFLFGREGWVGLRVYFARSRISFINWKTLLLLPHLRSSSQSLFTIESVTAYTSGKKLNFFENLKLFNKPQPTFKSQYSMKYI